VLKMAIANCNKCGKEFHYQTIRNTIRCVNPEYGNMLEAEPSPFEELNPEIIEEEEPIEG
jgi:predicted Zn-ribbon and HTH transcriptional regulator